MVLVNQYEHIDTSELPNKYPYPYTPEKFSKKEKHILQRFFTNHDKPVFAIYNLPQEVVGAMFSRYSRTAKSVRRLFLDEFWISEDLGISKYTADQAEEFEKARERTKNFYRIVFAQYGDDSVIQMGSVHVAFEYVSQIAAKAIEDQRIAAAYIEKSTRYVDFGNTENKHFLFMEAPEIMGSEFAKEYLKWNQSLFKAYVRNFDRTKKFLSKKYPLKKQTFYDPKTGEAASFSDLENGQKERAERAFNRALTAKSFDTVRIFLPTTTVTNLGAHFSGQAAEHTINKMISSPFSEVRLLGVMAYEELMRVSPNFLQNVDHRYGAKTREYLGQVRQIQEQAVESSNHKFKNSKKKNVCLVDYDKDSLSKIASQILYSAQGFEYSSKTEILEMVKKMGKKELQKFVYSANYDRSQKGINRRHKLSRAFEHAFAEVEFNVDFGIYRDLQRNRMSTTERQNLNADYLYIPAEYKETGMEKVLADYKKLFEDTKMLHAKIRRSSDPNVSRSAEYVTILGNKLRFNVRANLRQWVFFAELRTISGGHPDYRKAMQEAVRQIVSAMPWTKDLFTHVDWKKDYGLGRLNAEIKTEEKLEKVKDDTRN